MSIGQINSRLKSIETIAGFEKVQEAAKGATDTADALFKSKLGKQIGQTINGVESISEEVTETLPVIDGKLKDVFVGQTLGEDKVSVASVMQSIEAGLDPLANVISSAAGIFGGVADVVGGAVGAIDDIAESVGNVVGNVTGAITGAVSGAASGLLEAAAATIGDVTTLSGSLATTPQGIDDFNELVPGTSLARITAQSPLANLVREKKTTTTFIDDLDSDFGKLFVNEDDPLEQSFNIELITGAAPKAMADSMKEFAGIEPQVVLGDLKQFTTADVASKLDESVSLSIDGIVGQFQSNISSFVGSLNDALNSGFVGALRKVASDVSGAIDNTLNTIAGITNIADNIKQTVERELEGGNIRDAAAVLASRTSATETIEQIEARLNNVRTEVSSVAGTASKSTVAAQQVASADNTCSAGGVGENGLAIDDTTLGGTTTEASSFTYVDTSEELIAEFKAATREITEVVVHWTGNYNNQDIGSEWLDRVHKQRGFSEIGYHYVIRRNGSIQRGRSINTVGAHAKSNGHNNFSIGVAFVAGYNCNSGTPNPNNYISADSITSSQMETFYKFMRAFYEAWPGGQAWGHVDTDTAGKVDPGFSVPDYVRNNFNKYNVSASGQEPPLSRARIIQARGL